MKQILILTMVLIMAVGCETSSNSVELNNEIRYGTSFGMCVGYCISETVVSGSTATIKAKGWHDTVQTRQNTVMLSEEQLMSISEGINKEKFAELPETIGCPDCADGGAEWLELEVNGERKKVTFEYMENIQGMSGAISELRLITQENYPIERF